MSPNKLRQDILEKLIELNGQPTGKTVDLEAYSDAILDAILTALPNATHPMSGNFLNFGRTLWIDYRQVIEIISSAKSQQENNKEKS